MPIEPLVVEFLDAIGVVQDRLLPRSKEDDPELLQPYYLNRGHGRNVLCGAAPLTVEMAVKFGGRLQLLLEAATRDRQRFEAVLSARAALSPNDSEKRLLQVLDWAIDEEAAPISEIEDRERKGKQMLASRKRLGGAFHARIITLIDEMMKSRRNRETLTEMHSRLQAICAHPDAIVRYDNGVFRAIGWLTLLSRYSPEIYQILIPITWQVGLESFSVEMLEQVVAAFRERGFEITIRRVDRAEEGSTRLFVETSPADAARLMEAFRAGDLSALGITDIGQPALPKADSAITHADENLASSLNRALRAARLIRPWRRLRYLFSPFVARSPIVHTIGDSDNRAYAVPGVADRLSALRADLGMTLFLWPV